MGELRPGDPMAQLEVLTTANVAMGSTLMNAQEEVTEIFKVVAEDGLDVLTDDDEAPKVYDSAPTDPELAKLVALGDLVTAAQYAARERIHF